MGQDMKKRQANNNVTLSLSFELPDGHDGKITLRKDGESLYLVDEDGNIVTHGIAERSVHHEREKSLKPKIRAKSATTNGKLSISGLAELAEFDYFFAIDTNTKSIKGVSISAAFVAKFKLQKDPDGFRLQQCGTPPHLLEMRNCNGNPELAAILEIAMEELEAQKRLVPNYKFKVAFITDTELGLHNAFNNRLSPIHRQIFLPEGFSIIYSSTDTGNELTNKLIKFCDNSSEHHFKLLNEKGLPICKLQKLKSDPNTICRYLIHNMTISPDLVPSTVITESTKACITFEGDNGKVEIREINLR
jgi:hypothetical protein